MSVNSFSTPQLNYVGSVDLASASSGSTLYTILFDQSLCTLGNVLMFEYKITSSDVFVPSPGNTTLGFVNTENAIFTAGIQNQWQVAVPAEDHTYNPLVPNTIQMRVYSGMTGSTEIVVSDWSNSLDIHVPPSQPYIHSAFFNQNSQSGDDDLWVYMVPKPEYNYNDTQFIVAYFFQDETGQTLWKVSDPLYATAVPYGNTTLMQLALFDIGDVNTTTNTIYVAVYTVYPFVYSYNTYYSVSEISPTVSASVATNFIAPVIDSINYSVYTDKTTQNMIVNFTPGGASALPLYTVDYYVLESSLDQNTWTVVDGNIPSTSTSYTVDVSQYVCGNQLFYRLYAMSTSGAQSGYSNIDHMNIFKYADAPLSVVVNWASSNESETFMDLACTFTVATNYSSGCGVVEQWLVNVYDTNNVLITSKTVSYDQSLVEYLVYFDNIPHANQGYVEVFLQTIDTNPDPAGSTNFPTRDGKDDYGNFTPASIPIFRNVNIDNQRSLLTFDVLSQTVLGKIGRFIWEESNVVQNEELITSDVQPVILPNGVLQYSFNIPSSFFDPVAYPAAMPSPLIIAIANQVGINTTSV